MNDVAECKVSVWLVGDELDPDELRSWLGHAPAYQVRKGEAYRSKAGEEMVASTGRFQLTTGWQTGKPLEQLIIELLDQLPNDPFLWEKINTSLSGEVVCGLILDGVNEEAKLSPRSLLALGHRGLSLHLDIYDSGDGPVT
ncbi:DUF4279 domain-containing protein [Sphingomonas sp. PAMC 26621]|uniref:DUF4279 domain-containing protein n=1 Tax=Sphingomonas sp. PAMC 26621 TaxID=1112213 RepID=UPI0002898484|nr:DUF4279 domain-containing protein [Sphingomonas sp. PAMC 26621]